MHTHENHKLIVMEKEEGKKGFYSYTVPDNDDDDDVSSSDTQNSHIMHNNKIY